LAFIMSKSFGILTKSYKMFLKLDYIKGLNVIKIMSVIYEFFY